MMWLPVPAGTQTRCGGAAKAATRHERARRAQPFGRRICEWDDIAGFGVSSGRWWQWLCRATATPEAERLEGAIELRSFALAATPAVVGPRALRASRLLVRGGGKWPAECFEVRALGASRPLRLVARAFAARQLRTHPCGCWLESHRTAAGSAGSGRAACSSRALREGLGLLRSPSAALRLSLRALRASSPPSALRPALVCSLQTVSAVAR
jgi:hypothetical protein